MFAEYSRFEDFCAKYNLNDLQAWATAPSIGGMKGKEYCQFAPKAPTIGMMSDAYGVTKTAGWIANHINCLLKMFCLPPDRKPDVETLRQVGKAWICSWPQLKVTEIWVLFYDILGGKYGQIAYGGIELSTIGAYLAKHMEVRLDRQARFEQMRQANEAARERIEFSRRLKESMEIASSEEQWESLTFEEKENILFLADMYGLEPEQNTPNFMRDLQLYRRRRKEPKNAPTSQNSGIPQKNTQSRIATPRKIKEFYELFIEYFDD